MENKKQDMVNKKKKEEERKKRRKRKSRLGSVAHTCNPRYLGDRNRKIEVRGQPRQKIIKAPSQLISRVGQQL
jgi:hypothetical protein